MAGGLGRQHPGDVGAHQQPGDGGVAPEEPLLDGQQPDIGATEPVEQRPSTRAPYSPVRMPTGRPGSLV